MYVSVRYGFVYHNSPRKHSPNLNKDSIILHFTKYSVYFHSFQEFADAPEVLLHHTDSTDYAYTPSSQLLRVLIFLQLKTFAVHFSASRVPLKWRWRIARSWPWILMIYVAYALTSSVKTIRLRWNAYIFFFRNYLPITCLAEPKIPFRKETSILFSCWVLLLLSIIALYISFVLKNTCYKPQMVRNLVKTNFLKFFKQVWTSKSFNFKSF